MLYVAFGGLRWEWRPVVWAVAILTMAVGAIVAITQRDVKRMLAYSAIAHAGFILVGVAATTNQGLSGAMFYLVAYGFTTIAAFGIVTLVRSGESEAGDLSAWQGLGRRSPLIARHVRLPAARARRDPADQRVHRQVRGVLGRGGRVVRWPWSSSAWSPARSRRSSTSASSC